MFICAKPFISAEIDFNGDVYNCCRYHLPVKLGNMFEQPFDEVWNSENAKKIRLSVAKGDYTYCNKKACAHLQHETKELDYHEEISPDGTMSKGPKQVTFCHDKECNIACVICRDKIWRNSDEEIAELEEKTEKLFLPMLKDAEIVTMSAHGDALGSRHSRYLIKRIHEVYPHIKFDLFTNGILLNQHNLEDLGIEKNLNAVKVSLHAVKKETYSKMVRKGDLYFDTIKKNLQYISELKKTYNFEFLLFFVVTSFNYKEIPMFVHYAVNLGAFPTFTEYSDDQLQSWWKHPKFDITKEKHREYKNLITVLNDPCFKIEEVGLSPVLREIQAKRDLIPERKR